MQKNKIDLLHVENQTYVKLNAFQKLIKRLKTMSFESQEKVGGYIEYVRLNEDDDVILICNDEGKINGMGPNRDIDYDIIFGPFFVIGDNPDIGMI